jgi:hypothetical protein
MDSIAITAISGSMSDTRQAEPKHKKMTVRYISFLDEETTAMPEDDSVQLSDEAQEMQQADGHFESAA